MNDNRNRATIYLMILAAVLQYFLYSSFMVGLQSHLYETGRISFYENLKSVYYFVSFVSPFTVSYFIDRFKLRSIAISLVLITLLSFYMILWTGKNDYLYIYSITQGYTRASLLFLSIFVINHLAPKGDGVIYMSYLTSFFSFVVIAGSWTIAYVHTNSAILFNTGLAIGLVVVGLLFLIPRDLSLAGQHKDGFSLSDYTTVIKRNYLFLLVAALVFINWAIGESFITMWGTSMKMDKVHADELTSFFYLGGVVLTCLFVKFFHIYKHYRPPYLYVAQYSMSVLIILCLGYAAFLHGEDIVRINTLVIIFGGAVVSQATVVSNAIHHFIEKQNVKVATVILVALQHMMGIVTTYGIGQGIRYFKGTGFDVSVITINVLILVLVSLLIGKRRLSGRTY